MHGMACIFMQWNYKPEKCKKEEGKFWGTTVAPIQSSSSLGARLASAFRATRCEVIEYQNEFKNLCSESQKLYQKMSVDFYLPMSLTGEKDMLR